MGPLPGLCFSVTRVPCAAVISYERKMHTDQHDIYPPGPPGAQKAYLTSLQAQGIVQCWSNGADLLPGLPVGHEPPPREPTPPLPLTSHSRMSPGLECWGGPSLGPLLLLLTRQSLPTLCCPASCQPMMLGSPHSPHPLVPLDHHLMGFFAHSYHARYCIDCFF